MSKTPRTEALRADHGRRWGYIDHIGYGEMSRLAFDLERENAALREALRRFPLSCRIDGADPATCRCVGCDGMRALKGHSQGHSDPARTHPDYNIGAGFVDESNPPHMEDSPK